MQNFETAMKLLVIMGIIGALPFLSNTMSLQVLGQTSWYSSGPRGGYVTSIVVAPSEPSVVYVGTRSGVYKSVNDGENWSGAGLQGIGIEIILVDPKDANTVYAVSYENRFFRSVNGGADWTQEAIYHVSSLGIDPDNTEMLWAGTRTGRIYMSNNRGVAWTEKLHVQPGFSFEPDIIINSIVVDPEGSSGIFAGLGWSDYRFARSLDGGETWDFRKIGQRSHDYPAHLVTTPPGHEPQAIFIIARGGRDVDNVENVFMSTDKGDTWKELYIPVIGRDGHRSNQVTRICVHPVDPYLLYIVTTNPDYPLIRFNCNTNQWAYPNETLYSNPHAIDFNPDNPALAYAGFNNGDIYRSMDEGNTWELSKKGLSNSFVNDVAISSFSSSSAIVAISGRFQLQKTTDAGGSWDAVGPDAPVNANTITIDPGNPNRMFTGSGITGFVGTIRRTEDGGETWKRVDESSSSGPVRAIWVHPSNPDIVLALADDRSYWSYDYTFNPPLRWWISRPGGVRRSTDGGENWNLTYSWGSQTTRLASDPDNPDVVYMGTARMGYVNRSTNAGASWTPISPYSNWTRYVNDIIVDSGSKVYTAVTDYEDNEMGGIWKFDQKAWSHIARFQDTDITALAINRRTSPETIYAGTSGLGVFSSEDGGETWSEFNNGLDIMNISRLEVSSSEPKMLYAGTHYGGVWAIKLEYEQYTVSVTIVPESAGTVTGEGTYNEGDEVTLEVVANEGYDFINWTDTEGEEIHDDPVYSFIMPATDVEVIANMDVLNFADEAPGHQDNISLFPNPASEEFFILSEENMNFIEIAGYNGKVVYTKEINGREIRIPTRAFQSGVYIVRIRTGKGVYFKRVVIL